ncbi:Pectinesterase inhibitor 7 [Sesamum alatum]|uniref:Pectinesterase inhibitor 7 n=1 Tax=Sesamum alatum TaxID=300844 RepID=A0AAE2CR93_9LAMI|nr:Pectinesterase inhibitor 7 [Sesamum alatum]
MESLTSPSLNLLFITILTLFLFISHVHSISGSSVPQAYTNFVKKSCNTTTYPPVCLKTLAPHASSIKTNPLSLCKYALKVAIQATRDSSTTVSKLAKRKDIPSTEARAVKECIGDLKDAVYQLKQTVEAMGHLKDADREFQWANAKTYASAAITDAETCVDEFLDRKVDPVVKNKIKGCVSDVEKLISNALSLINHLY